MQTSNPEAGATPNYNSTSTGSGVGGGGGGGVATNGSNGGKHQNHRSSSTPTPDGDWGTTAKEWALRWRGSRQLVLVIVAIALLLDNMLLTVVGEFLISSKLIQAILN